ncbi:single-stranded DNA-binding protein [Pricia sp. S334]|uniref:Single-stranded DNA-binding protein n=1 Tax=Pricia mediterranea TaxID=3076079 RepID=A0ABU3L608_9FLAO|nr:single-stranded DNA-binding protein [Pricia sp. S334]MDT7829176.1 single-stranded DNA-binding protein [Pricia sp. S334]
MSGTLNKVMLIGNLGDEVKMHYFENGDCIGRFPIATSETYTSKKTGERTTTTEWHNIIVRNKAAEICEKYLNKGDKVYIEGRLRTRQWQDDTGNTRYSTEVQAQDFTFLTPKGQSNPNAPQRGESQGPMSDSANSGNDKAAASSKNTSASSRSEEDDLPF